MNDDADHLWKSFDAYEDWFAGRVLWLWAPSWNRPRLAVADDDEGGDWNYEAGEQVGSRGEQFPTHRCAPTRPLPPRAG